MFYVFSILIPVLILGIGYLIAPKKPRSFKEIVGFLATLLPYLFCYALLLYFVNMEGYIDTGWAFFSVIFFLLPVGGVVLLLKLIYWIRAKKSMN